jgi:hypothetical protein
MGLEPRAKLLISRKLAMTLRLFPLILASLGLSAPAQLARKIGANAAAARSA